MDAPSPQPLPSRRRKVRKGTFSCWECKRRKRRCEFLTGSSSLCASCQRRGLPCLSQEQYEPETGPEQVSERVRHVEDLVGMLLQQRQQQQQRPLARRDTPQLRNGNSVSIPPSPSGSSLSITAYLYSVLPSPSDTASIVSYGHSSRMPRWAGWAISAPLLEPPPLEAQPIWYGRRLMQIALRLQDSNIPGWDASRYAQVVAHWISPMDSFVSSIEGIETLMLEAMYYVNEGRLKEGWLRCRRAISIAQLLGLDRSGWTTNAMLRRLIFGDRAMSLELGVAHFGLTDYGSLDKDCDPVIRLERIHVVMATRIIERNLCMIKGGLESVHTETLNIDRVMRRIMKDLPAGWWSTKGPLSELSEDEAMTETAKLVNQLNHYWLLTYLHQPLVIQDLCCPTNLEENSYSRSVLAASCRQVLSRFQLIRKYHNGGIYRGVDPKVIFASIGLLLAHVDGHRDSNDNALEHLRPQDRDLIRDIIVLLGGLSSPKLELSALDELLKIESDAADGSNFMLSACLDGGLRLKLPYFGTMSLILVPSATDNPAVARPISPTLLTHLLADN